MGIVKRKLSKTFNDFFDSERSSGILLIVCTIVSLLITNSIIWAEYLSLWQTYVGGSSIEHWINDALMASFCVPASLKVFLTALAVMDDLGAIIVIAIFYTSKLTIAYLISAMVVFGLLVAINRLFRVMRVVLGSRCPSSLRISLSLENPT